jgi:hypothetical protein
VKPAEQIVGVQNLGAERNWVEKRRKEFHRLAYKEIGTFLTSFSRKIGPFIKGGCHGNEKIQAIKRFMMILVKSEGHASSSAGFTWLYVLHTLAVKRPQPRGGERRW